MSSMYTCTFHKSFNCKVSSILLVCTCIGVHAWNDKPIKSHSYNTCSVQFKFRYTNHLWKFVLPYWEALSWGQVDDLVTIGITSDWDFDVITCHYDLPHDAVGRHLMDSVPPEVCELTNCFPCSLRILVFFILLQHNPMANWVLIFVIY